MATTTFRRTPGQIDTFDVIRGGATIGTVTKAVTYTGSNRRVYWAATSAAVNAWGNRIGGSASNWTGATRTAAVSALIHATDSWIADAAAQSARDFATAHLR